MGYSTRQEVIDALANALSRGNPQAGGGTGRVDIIGIGNTLSSTVPEETLQQYIRWADENIDAWLGGTYTTPFYRVNRGSFIVASDITAGDTFVLIDESTRFNQGDVILIRDGTNSQELTVTAVPSSQRLDLSTPIVNSYMAAPTRVERLKYPDPIPKISARLAASNVYDKYYAAQVDGNKSDVAAALRKKAYADLNGILSGAIKLYIADATEFMGRRYYNPALDDNFSTRAKPGDQWIKED